MKISNYKEKAIRTAAIIAIIGNSVLALLKMAAGIVTGSGALIGDGIDSSTDVLISIITLIVTKVITKPADAGHPWGHRRAETVAAIFLSFLISLAGIQLIISSVTNLITSGRQVEGSPAAIAIVIISIIGKILLAWSQFVLGKKAGSVMIKANAKNMASDVLISFGVLIGLILSSLTNAPYADSIIAIFIGLWIIKTAVGIFLEANLELMDGSRDMEPYRIIIEAVNIVEGASNPHRARIRSIAGYSDIDLDIDVDPECTVLEAHRIASQVEHEIRLRLENVYDIMIHIEPRGDTSDEVFGLSESEMRGDNSK